MKDRTNGIAANRLVLWFNIVVPYFFIVVFSYSWACRLAPPPQLLLSQAMYAMFMAWCGGKLEEFVQQVPRVQ